MSLIETFAILSHFYMEDGVSLAKHFKREKVTNLQNLHLFSNNLKNTHFLSMTCLSNSDWNTLDFSISHISSTAGVFYIWLCAAIKSRRI